MLNLSRRGWNNVLIFASIFMILIFNGVHQKLLNNSSLTGQLVNLLPEDQIIITLDLANHSIERVGREWRTQPKSEHSQVELAKLIQAWYNTQAKVLPETELSQFNLPQFPDWIAVAWLAGQPKGYVMQAYQFEQHTLLFDKQRALWFDLANQQAAALQLK